MPELIVKRRSYCWTVKLVVDKRTAKYLKAMTTGLSNMIEREILSEEEKRALKRARSAIRGAIGRERTMPKLVKPKKKPEKKKEPEKGEGDDTGKGGETSETKE